MKKIASLMSCLFIITMAFAQPMAPSYKVKQKDRTKYHGTYSAFGDYKMDGKTFYIESGSSDVSSNDVEFKQYANCVSQIIKWNHGILTKDKLNADVLILMDYRLTDESYVETRTFPIWGNTGISSITTDSYTTGSATGSGSGYSSGGYSSASGSVYGESHTTTTTDVQYRRGITGVGSISNDVENYRRVLNLYAYDNKQREGEPVMLWKVNGNSEGSSDDLSKVLPHMVKHMRYFIGRSSEGKKKVFSYDDDFFVKNLNKNLFSQENTYLNPYYREKTDNDLTIFSITTNDTETQIMVCVNKQMNTRFSEWTYIVKGNQKVKLSSIDNAKIGKYKWFEEMTYYTLHFPIKLKKGDYINLVSYKNSKEKNVAWSWNTLLLQ